LRLIAEICAATVAVLISGCGGSQGPPLSPVASLPACAKAGSAVTLPPDFPRSFPLPPGTVVTLSQPTDKGAIFISGFIPLNFKEAIAFWQSKLPAAGYQPLEGDAEMDEAESIFAGEGFRGKWKINGLLNCPGAVSFAVSLSKA